MTTTPLGSDWFLASPPALREVNYAQPKPISLAQKTLFTCIAYIYYSCVVLPMKLFYCFFEQKNTDTPWKSHLKNIVTSSHPEMPMMWNEMLADIMERLRAECPQSSTSLIVDALAVPELRDHYHELLAGASVVIHDKGYFFDHWKHLKEAYPRYSSHHYQGEDCYGFQGPLLDELLFWKDLDGNTRFQVEAHPLTSAQNMILHILDYLTYKATGKQVGQVGNSFYTEAHPLRIQLVWSQFKQNRDALLNEFGLRRKEHYSASSERKLIALCENPLV